MQFPRQDGTEENKPDNIVGEDKSSQDDIPSTKDSSVISASRKANARSSLPSDTTPQKVSRQLSNGERSFQSLQIARRRPNCITVPTIGTSPGTGLDKIIDDIPRDLADKLDLLHVKDQTLIDDPNAHPRNERPRSSHQLMGISFRRTNTEPNGVVATNTNASSSKQTSRSSWRSSISSVFSSMRSIIILTADLDDDDDGSLDISSSVPTNKNSRDDRRDEHPPRFPWRQSSWKSSGNSKSRNSSRSSIYNNGGDEESPKSSADNKSRTDNSAPGRLLWHQGSSRKGIFQTLLQTRQAAPSIERIVEVEHEHDASATLRMSTSSACTINPAMILSVEHTHLNTNNESAYNDLEIPFPVRRESLATACSKQSKSVGRSSSSRRMHRSGTSSKVESVSPGATLLEKKSFLKRQLKFPKRR